MSKNQIDKLLYYSSIESNLELVKFFLKQANEHERNEKFNNVIDEFLFKKVHKKLWDSYTLIGPKYSLSCLVSTFLSYYIREEDFEKQKKLLENLVNMIEGFGVSKARSLKVITTHKLLEVLFKFGFPEECLRTKNFMPLTVFHIPLEHVEFNASYYPFINSIASYKPKIEATPEYIFFHEVGHLLVYNLTGNPEKLPQSFIDLNRELNPEWEGDLLEVFVDIFSVVIMKNTEYEDKNPFISGFDASIIKIFYNYFSKIIADLTPYY